MTTVSPELEDMLRRVCDGEGDADFVRMFADKIEEAENYSLAISMLSSWADRTPSEDYAWAYKRVADLHTKLGNRGAANLAMRKVRKSVISLVKFDDHG